VVEFNNKEEMQEVVEQPLVEDNNDNKITYNLEEIAEYVELKTEHEQLQNTYSELNKNYEALQTQFNELSETVN